MTGIDHFKAIPQNKTIPTTPVFCIMWIKMLIDCCLLTHKTAWIYAKHGVPVVYGCRCHVIIVAVPRFFTHLRQHL